MTKVFCVLAASTVAAVSGFASLSHVADGNVSATGDYIRSNGSRMIIDAIQHKDGTVSGSMYFQSTTGQVIIAAVDSLIVIENSAYLHGIVISSDQNPSLLGRHSYHRVVDNGEGRGNEADRAATFANLLNPPADPIAFLSSTSPILEGNIQVRG